MPSFSKFNCFVEDLGNGVHDLSSHALKIMLTNTAPAATDTVDGDIAEISAGNGYSAGGMDVTGTSWGQTDGVGTLSGTGPSLTASGGDIGPFQWAVLYNNSAGSASNRPLIGYWDYGNPLTISSGDTGEFNMVSGNKILLVF